MIEIYKKYFKDIAIAKMGHVDGDNETFFYVKDKYDPKAFDDALKSVACGAALMLEAYTNNLDDNNNDNNRDYINGRVTFVFKAEHGNKASIDAAHALAEKNCKRLAIFMRDDLQQNKVLSDGEGNSARVTFKLKNVSIDPVGPMAGSYYGATMGFVWQCPLSVAVEVGNWLS